jgi:hypothetical protein
MSEYVDHDALIGAVARALAEGRVYPGGGARPEAVHEIYTAATGDTFAVKTIRDNLSTLAADGRLETDWGVEGQPRRGYRPASSDGEQTTGPGVPRYPSEVAHD